MEMQTDDTASPQVDTPVSSPATQKFGSKKKTLFSVFLLMFVVAVVTLSMVPNIRATCERIWTALTLAPELEQFSLSRAPSSHEGWFEYKKKGIGFISAPTTSHSPVPAVRSEGHTVEVGEKGRTIILDGRPIYTAPSVPLQLALSGAGNHIAFVIMSLQKPPQNTTPDSLDALMRTYAASSHIYLLDARTKKVQDLGIGYSPVFLDETHILRLTSGGMIVTDLTTGKDTTVFTGSFDTFQPLVVGPDASRVAFQAKDKTIHVYEVGATQAKDILTIPSPKGALTALTSDMLYTVSADQKGSDVWSYMLTDASEVRHVQHFPESFKVLKLTP
jgi:hypothetical protein